MEQKVKLLVLAIFIAYSGLSQNDTISVCFKNVQKESSNHPTLTVKNFNNVSGVQFWTSWSGGHLESFGVNNALDPDEGSLVLFFQDTFFRLSYFRHDLQPISIPQGQSLITLNIGTPISNLGLSNVEFSWLDLPYFGVYPVKEDCSTTIEVFRDPISKIYPNPSSGNFTVLATADIQIFDTIGGLVYHGSPEFVPKNLPIGIYFCKGTGNARAHKLIIK